MKAPKFLLPPLPRFLLQNPLPSAPYFVKIDLSEALYHVTLHPATRTLTTFQIDSRYYRFVRLPFGIRTPLLYAIVNALTRHLRSQCLWSWGHIDNVLLAHSDANFLLQTYNTFLQELSACGFKVNPNDTTFTPTITIHFLGFELSGANMTIAHLPECVYLVHKLLSSIRTDTPLTYLRRAVGLLAFYLSRYRTVLFSFTTTLHPYPLRAADPRQLGSPNFQGLARCTSLFTSASSPTRTYGLQ